MIKISGKLEYEHALHIIRTATKLVNNISVVVMFQREIGIDKSSAVDAAFSDYLEQQVAATNALCTELREAIAMYDGLN